MVTALVTNQAGPSTPASKDNKAKRPRKRNRNKKRTTEVEHSSSDSSDESDDENKSFQASTAEQEKSESQISSPTKPSTTEKKAFARRSDDDDSHNDGEAGDADGKRKRKRKRTTKLKSAEGNTEVAEVISSASVPATSTPKTFIVSSEKVGPDPNTDLRLSDQAKQAIQYAQLYTKDKSQWKFNKAKQNWLLRNALSVPPSDYDSALARKQPDSKASAEGVADGLEAAEEGENFVPEDFVPVVTAYLNSVMGGARQRLIESLKEAVNAPAVVITTQPQVTSGAAKTTITSEDSPNCEAKKSVSFGNLAMEEEKKEEAVEALGLPVGTDPRAVELQRTRATHMLQHMGEHL
ncbi:uncharacterized protein MEPE_01876 [Melanopsichium pennsylvanicum]|uniref:WKF domain-containing protein n=2 Tax=Melanopsichium pennsylvanicum TaxID=63383 RepID=A0AAJ4XJ81_9BASI|nr:conserved hypothetical protein [Melanopsichium pennsylvanicum 4]SNX83170.1 uncharacterized protein MEPE_01876 [Melanopsichium pennsylvanicum]